MSFTITYGYMQQTHAHRETFALALAFYRDHRNDDRDGARIYNDDRSDGESDGLTDEERDQVDAIDHLRPDLPVPVSELEQLKADHHARMTGENE